MSTPKVHGGSPEVNTQQNSSMQRQDILFGKSLQAGNFMRHGKFGEKKVELKNFTQQQRTQPQHS